MKWRMWFDKLAAKRGSRVAIAALLAAFQLVMFDCAGHRKLDLPFNSAPGQAPAYSDVHFHSTSGRIRQPHHWSRLLVSRWDAEHYIGFAVRGLTSCPTDGAAGHDTDVGYLECGLGWPPAYGKVGGIVSSITSIAPDYALLILSVLAAFLANLLWTSAPFVKRLGDREALGALLAFNVFPSAFFLVTPYPDAAMLAFALAAFGALATERWLLAGVLVGAATALRTGAVAFSIGFVLAAGFAAYKRKRAGDAKWWKPLLGIPLCFWSLAVQMIALSIAVGDAFAISRAQAALHDAFHLSHAFSASFLAKSITGQNVDGIVLIGCLAVVAVAGRETVKRLGAAESIFIITASLVGLWFGIDSLAANPDGTLAGAWGLSRYLLACPIVFMCAGVLLRKHLGFAVVLLVLSLAVYWHVELCSYITQGNPELCPCLGRPQLGMSIES